MRVVASLLIVAAFYAPRVSALESCTKVVDATPEEIEWVRAAMQERLKDADSAKFMSVKRCDEEVQTVCGLVNSKNSYGAYAGYSAFMGMLIPRGKTAIIIGVDEADRAVTAEMCSESGLR